MPCKDYEYESEPKVTQTEFDKLLKKHHATTALLCKATQVLKKIGALNTSDCPAELRQWHIEHEKADREEAIRVAKAKLTPEERQLLGL